MKKLIRKFSKKIIISIVILSTFYNIFSKNLDEYILKKEFKKIEIDKFSYDTKIEINRKRYINAFQWNVAEILIFNDSNKIDIKSIKDIKDINHIIFEDKKIEKTDNIVFSDKTIISMADNEVDYREWISSKQNIVKNKQPDYKNPKIIKFNGKDIENPIIYEINHKGYMFRIVGDEKLYENQEIKSFIRYMKSLEIYF